MSNKKAEKKETSLSESLGLDKFMFKIHIDERIIFILGFILFLVGLFMLVAFVSYFSTGEADQSLVTSLQEGEVRNANQEFQNICGSIGAITSHFMIARSFGLAAFLIPVFIILVSLKWMRAYKDINLLKCFFGLTLLMIWCSVAFAKFLAPAFNSSIFNPGGDHGLFCSQYIENIIGTPGLIAILAAVAIAFLVYVSAETVYAIQHILNPLKFFQSIPFSITNESNTPTGEASKDKTLGSILSPNTQEYDDPTPTQVTFTNDDGVNVVNGETKEEKRPEFGTIRPRKPKKEVGMEIEVGKGDERATGNTLGEEDPLSTPINPKEPFTRYQYPTLDLLKHYENDGKPYIDESEQLANKNQIVKVLNSFGVQIREIKATVGPTITLYEITPAEGVRISKIRNLQDDIALSLAALGIRIIAPIPGKGTIGIEVPNKKPNIVSMRSILDSKKFQESKMELPIALGKTITNEVFMVDLAKIPHLLVAGATGQGKSVGLNAIITSLLYKKHPNELKLVLIDPKKVEFSVYSPIADHFMASVGDDDEVIITDVTKVVRTLKSLCALMDHRYDMLKMVKARNIKEYNQKYVNHLLNPAEGHEYMPYIVVVIDEFGDLILTAGKEIELPIARIAQLARAVGIHMVIATQRPTTSIITGNIKANFPGRMAFKVSAMIDSRTILDRPGANQLVGRGDMLFLSGSEPTRVQCAFIDTPEVETINEYINKQPGPTAPLDLPEPISEESMSEGVGGGMMEGGSKLDPIIEEAARSIVLTQQGSTSMIQRRFSIGYNRAGRLMDQLEKIGIVGPAQGSRPRDVLIPDENSLNNLFMRMKEEGNL
ncbi:MAG: DNA translocase FtsK 4TM domain-containing protein [Prevotella sp.]|nr:DNA translocase FtsK 4TM domain-containing protein [Prevotella sp.]